jgi:hypothetical protein
MHNENQFWWQADERIAAGIIFDVVDKLITDQQMIHNVNLQNYRLYNDTQLASLSLSGYTRPASADMMKERVTFNVIKSMVDTLTSKITKSKVKCTFLTSEGSWEEQKKGKLLDKYVQGQFYQTKIYDIAPRICLDCLVFGTGVLKIYEDDNEIKIDRVFPDEIVVDDNESRYAEPRQMFQLKMMNREVLKALFPDKADDIERASEEENNRNLNERVAGITDDQVLCIEAWHLPSAKGAGDGRHMIAVDGLSLLNEDWTRDSFPFAFLHYGDRLLGFWGVGLAEMLTGIQRQINGLLLDIQQAMNLFKPAIIIEGQIAKNQISNEIGRVITLQPGSRYYDYVPRAIGGEWFSHLDRLFDRAYQIAGVSELSAQSRKPVGLESGVALREFSDIETERFMAFAERYENFFINVGEQLIDLARHISAHGKDYSVISHGDKSIEKIKWSEISLDKSKYVMKVFPTNFLPETPAGKLQFITELAESGAIQDKSELLKLLNYPDIDRLIQRKTASLEVIDMMIDDMLSNGIYTKPEPFMNLTLAMEKANEAYFVAKLQNAPEENTNLLLDFIEDIMDLLSKMASASQGMAPPEMVGQPPPGGAAPPGMGPPPGVVEGQLPPELAGGIPEGMGPEALGEMPMAPPEGALPPM